jgi:hypothetical protein
MSATAIQTTYLGVGQITKTAKKALGQEIFDDELIALYDIAEVLGVEMRGFALASEASFTFGFVIAFIVILAQMVWMAWGFRTKVLNARKGSFDFSVRLSRYADCSNYVGLTISNSFIVFFLFTVIMALLALLLAWHITRDILFSRTLWVRLILPMGLPIIVNIALKELWVYQIITIKAGPRNIHGSNEKMLHRRWYHMYDIIMIVFRLFTGPITALVRFFMGVGIAFLTLPRMDVSPLPGWFERYMLLDTGSKAYHGMVLMMHRMSHPIHNVSLEVWAHATFRRLSGTQEVDRWPGVIHTNGEISNGEWIHDPKYAAGHLLYKKLTEEGRPFTPVEKWNGPDNKKTKVGPKRWHLAVMLTRMPQLREWRVFERYEKKRKKKDKSDKRGGSAEVAIAAEDHVESKDGNMYGDAKKIKGSAIVPDKSSHSKSVDLDV